MVKELFKGGGKAKIVQFSDDNRSLPDGSKIIYAESEDKIVLYHKAPFQGVTTYVYDRRTGGILVNGREGNNTNKRRMIELGSYILSNAKDDELVTLTVHTKGV